MGDGVIMSLGRSEPTEAVSDDIEKKEIATQTPEGEIFKVPPFSRDKDFSLCSERQ